jgi:serine/threonine protein kinase
MKIRALFFEFSLFHFFTSLTKGYISEAAVLSHITGGLKILHEKGLVQLDLKPENKLVVESPDPVFTVKPTDSCLTGTIFSDNSAMETWQTEICTALEICQAKGDDDAAEMRSLGVVSFKVRCRGRTPA